MSFRGTLDRERTGASVNRHRLCRRPCANRSFGATAKPLRVMAILPAPLDDKPDKVCRSEAGVLCRPKNLCAHVSRNTLDRERTGASVNRHRLCRRPCANRSFGATAKPLRVMAILPAPLDDKPDKVCRSEAGVLCRPKNLCAHVSRNTLDRERTGALNGNPIRSNDEKDRNIIFGHVSVVRAEE